MEFSKDNGEATYHIQSYRQGCVKVNGQEYYDPLMIMPETLIAPWEVSSIDKISQQDFVNLLSYQPQVILVGTGQTVHYLEKDILSPALEQGIGVEIMTSSAACRTYTLLMSEGRNVAAIIFP